MNIALIDGVFSAKEGEALLTSLFQVKIRFHEDRIRTVHQTEEDIEHSEKRIMQLQDGLREALQQLRESGRQEIALHANIELSPARHLSPA